MPVFSVRLRTIFSRPSKAPPQMKRMLVVSTWTKSWFGCLRPPWGGTEAMVPPISFRSPCGTPPPEPSPVLASVAVMARAVERSRVGKHAPPIDMPDQALREEYLAPAGGPDQQNVGLG